MRRFLLLVLLSLVAFGCKGGSIVGQYRVQQDANALGTEAEEGTLEIKQDGTFTLSKGTTTLSKGTWKMEDRVLTMTEPSRPKPTEYKIDGDRLIPLADGQEITEWRFVRQ